MTMIRAFKWGKRVIIRVSAKLSPEQIKKAIEWLRDSRRGK